MSSKESSAGETAAAAAPLATAGPALGTVYVKEKGGGIQIFEDARIGQRLGAFRGRLREKELSVRSILYAITDDDQWNGFKRSLDSEDAFLRERPAPVDDETTVVVANMRLLAVPPANAGAGVVVPGEAGGRDSAATTTGDTFRASTRSRGGFLSSVRAWFCSARAPADGSEDLASMRKKIDELLAFHRHEDKSEDMSAVTSEPLKLKKKEYKEVAPVNCTQTGTVPSFDWLDEDGEELKEKENHPHLQKVLNKTLEPAGFYALLPTNTAKEDTTYPLSSGAARKVKGQPDAYIFKLVAGFNRNAKVDLGNMGRAVAVVEWKKPSKMEVDGSYSQMCFEVFAFALFSFHASKGSYQVFESAVTGMGRSYLMPLDRAILELVEWLKEKQKPIQHALPVIPEDELDGDSGEGHGSGDGGGSERRSGEGGSGGGSSGEGRRKPSDGTGANKSSSAGSQRAPMRGSGRKARRLAPCAAGSIHVTPPKDETAREAEEDDIESACTADDSDDGEGSWPTEAADEEGCFEMVRLLGVPDRKVRALIEKAAKTEQNAKAAASAVREAALAAGAASNTFEDRALASEVATRAAAREEKKKANKKAAKKKAKAAKKEAAKAGAGKAEAEVDEYSDEDEDDDPPCLPGEENLVDTTDVPDLTAMLEEAMLERERKNNGKEAAEGGGADGGRKMIE